MTAVLNRIKKLWDIAGSDFQGVVQQEPLRMKSEPFVAFPCPACDFALNVEKFIYPGDAAVLVCPNCNTSVTVYSDHLHIFKTKEIPPGKLQEVVWGKLSE